MSDTAYVVQKVEWYQLRGSDGQPFFVMLATTPNGFVTAVPCRVTMQLADHTLMALAPSADEALAQIQKNLGGKTADELFAVSHG